MVGSLKESKTVHLEEVKSGVISVAGCGSDSRHVTKEVFYSCLS